VVIDGNTDTVETLAGGGNPFASATIKRPGMLHRHPGAAGVHGTIEVGDANTLGGRSATEPRPRQTASLNNIGSILQSADTWS
jgi:hypothetical protein